MELVADAQKLEAVFGRWPSFRDAEVLSIVLDRDANGATRGPAIHLCVCVFEMTSEVDAQGFYVLRSHVVVTFALYSAEVLRLEGFNLQNVLSGLHFSEASEPAEPDLVVQVDLGPRFGVKASFQCARAAVVLVEPFTPRARDA